MKAFIILAIFTSIGFTSCKKDQAINIPNNNNAPTQVTATRYTHMNIGAYWLYKVGNIDTLENFTYLSSTYDSVYVSGDTIVNGNKHFILEHTKPSFRYFGFNGSTLHKTHIDSAAQYIIPYYFSTGDIGDTIASNSSFPWLPGLILYSIPNYYYNMQTVLGIKNGIRIETHSNYPTGYPEYFNRFFGYDAYIENVGMNRKVVTFSSGPITRQVYELVGYGGFN